MNGNVFSSEGIAPTLTTNKGEGNKVAVLHTHTQFAMDKTVFGTERRIANTITAREDRGISIHNQEGTAVGIIVNEDTE